MLAVVVLISLVGLAIGPALVALGRGRAVPSAAIEGLTLGMVPALIAVRILPHVHASIGVFAIALTAFGYLALWLADRWGHRSGARVGHAVIVPALALHALTDGAALAVAVAAIARGSAAERSGMMLGAVLLLHRLPEGLFLAATLVPIVGWRRTMHRLGLVGAATVAGAVIGRVLLDTIPDALVDGVVALGLGAMLRLALHTHSPAPTERASRRASGVAFAIGLAVALAVPVADDVLRRAQPRELSVMQTLGPLFVETAPAMLAGLVFSALLRAALPRRTTAWLRTGKGLGRALRGVAFGAGRPWCACGVLPMGRRMLAEGIAPAAVFAFVVTAPVLALDGLMLTARLLGPVVTVLVGAGAVAMALAAGAAAMAVGASDVARKKKHVALHVVPDDEPPAPRSLTGRLKAAAGEAFGSALDESGPWFVTGLFLAAVLEAGSRGQFAAAVHAPLDVVVVGILATPFAIASQGAAPLAAMLLHKGCSIGAGVALLVIGPSLHVALSMTVRRVIGARAGLALTGSVWAVGIMTGTLANLVVPHASVPAIHALATHVHRAWEWVCAIVFGALLVASLLRIGPREWFGNLAIVGDEREPGEHDHGHAHGHDHPPNEGPPYPAVPEQSQG
jgi:uncharacterized membrane protein YraQ (UPF0718 family)